jgi:uncharacterized protein YdhG (YjbR/CyaY superfamily)
MPRQHFETSDEYIATFPADKQAVLEQIRSVVKTLVPNAEEVISYQIPAFKYHGMLVFYSGYTSHVSLSFPPSPALFEKFKNELADYKLSKSTIQFPLDKPLPMTLIKEIVKFRVAENLERQKKR